MTHAREPEGMRRVARQADQGDPAEWKPADGKARLTQDWSAFQQKLLADSRKSLSRGTDALSRLALEGMPSGYDAAVADSYMDQQRHARPVGAPEIEDAEEVSSFFDEFTPGSEALAEEHAICSKCGKVVPGTWTTFLICPTDGPQIIYNEDGTPKKRASMVEREDAEAIELARKADIGDVIEAARQLGENVAWQRPLGNMEKVEHQTEPENEDLSILQALEHGGNDESAWAANPLDRGLDLDDDEDAPPDSGVDPGGV